MLIKLDGSKHWCFDYTRPVIQKINTLAFGSYPEVSLLEARAKRDEVRKLLAKEIDPSEQRKVEVREAKLAANNTFQTIALEWLDKQGYQPSSNLASGLLVRLCQ